MVRFHDRRNATGFSLLEVLVAIVVLTVGLLALAALQGSLTRASSEAKVRGRVAAMLTARLDDMRSSGYGSAEMAEGSPGPWVRTTANACDGDDSQFDWIDCAVEQSNIGSLTVNQTVTTWYGNGTFATGAPDPADQDPRVAQFKRVELSATWTDAAGSDHTQRLVSDVSSMSLTNFVVVPPDPTENPTGGPIVRTINPATAGVIPIAIGPEDNTQNTSTTNPTPELVGQRNNQQVVGTRFSVLTYTPPGFGNSVVINKRFDNEVVKCNCKYGAGGNNLPEIYRTALWPAIWTGERYEVYMPEGNIAAPGQNPNQAGPRNGVTQSQLCQECCRDHHDNGTGVEFDPERIGAETKFDADNQGALSPVPNTNNANYVDSCRLVRIDGFWRTAADLYQRQFGLLETQSQGGAAAKSGLPTTAAVTQYTTFVKNFLSGYDGTGTGAPPSDAQAAFTANGPFDTPALVTIASANNTDYRYLHARGLYVDHLEQKALEQIAKARAWR